MVVLTGNSSIKKRFNFLGICVLMSNNRLNICKHLLTRGIISQSNRTGNVHARINVTLKCVRVNI